MTLTSFYDQLNARVGLSDNLTSAGVTIYAYDAAHRLTTITRSYGGVAGPQVAYGYDPGNRVTSEARTIGGSGTAMTTSLAYDVADRLTTLTHQVSGGSALATYAYGYDNANRLTTEAVDGSTTTYTYDNTNELTAAGGARTESYGYDSGGNRNTAGYTTGYGTLSTSGNELTAAPGATYAYDAEGNRTGMTNTATGTTTTYAYDFHERMTGATTKNSVGTTTLQVTYTYDALNRRIGTNVSGGGSAGQVWTVYDGQSTYADFVATGSLKVRYLYGPAVDALLARTDSGGTTAWYLTERLGSVRDVVNAAGTPLDRVAYDSFGIVTAETNVSSGDRFKFAAREFDVETIVYYNRARHYDPKVGRFDGQDPSGFAGGDGNLYRYVGNNPANGTDPTGLFDLPIVLPRPIYPTEPYPLPPRPNGPFLPRPIYVNPNSAINAGITFHPSTNGQGPRSTYTVSHMSVSNNPTSMMRAHQLVLQMGGEALRQRYENLTNIALNEPRAAALKKMENANTLISGSEAYLVLQQGKLNVKDYAYRLAKTKALIIQVQLQQAQTPYSALMVSPGH